MVKKLIKHEFGAYTRSLLPFEVAMLGIALLTRFVQFFENGDKIAYNICSVSSIIAFVVCAIVLTVGTFFVGITRFYKNLFTLEGYLTFTLPVTTMAHLFTKILVSVTYTLISFFVIIISILTATLGDLSNEIIKAFNYLVKFLFETLKLITKYNTVNGIFYIIEALIIAITLITATYLLFYGCISVGQLAKKNRILASIGAYFAYYLFTQVVGTVFLILVSLNVFEPLVEALNKLLINHPVSAIHVFLTSAFIFEAILCTIYYFISYKIIKNKLNLE